MLPSAMAPQPPRSCLRPGISRRRGRCHARGRGRSGGPAWRPACPVTSFPTCRNGKSRSSRSLGAGWRGGPRRRGREGNPARRDLRRHSLTLWDLRSSGRGGPSCNGPMSIDITPLQLDFDRGQLASPRCELTSAQCQLTWLYTSCTVAPTVVYWVHEKSGSRPLR